MRRMRKRTFEELVLENKQELLKDEEALKRIEDRLEEKMLNKAE
ncbi:MAG: FbpB family small basic protein [Bacillaceae bacterium]|nr:FbpB family small basic protein [Bacillaceae bacterium]